jgi:hypothetical protein
MVGETGNSELCGRKERQTIERTYGKTDAGHIERNRRHDGGTNGGTDVRGGPRLPHVGHDGTRLLAPSCWQQLRNGYHRRPDCLEFI